MLTSIDVIVTQEGRIQNSRQNGMQSSTYSASNTSYHQCYFYRACYVLGKSVPFFFLENKSTAPRPLLSFLETIIRESALCFRISERALGFKPMRNVKIFKRIIARYWMRLSMIWYLVYFFSKAEKSNSLALTDYVNAFFQARRNSQVEKKSR